jgi:hypothetical protein
MPLDETIKYSKGLKDFKRIETVNNSSNVLMYFLKRFQNLMRLKLSVILSWGWWKASLEFWHFRHYLNVLELVIEKIKSWIVMSTNIY